LGWVQGSKNKGPFLYSRLELALETGLPLKKKWKKLAIRLEISIAEWNFKTFKVPYQALLT
jgi:hypothetical protein